MASRETSIFQADMTSRQAPAIPTYTLLPMSGRSPDGSLMMASLPAGPLPHRRAAQIHPSTMCERHPTRELTHHHQTCLEFLAALCRQLSHAKLQCSHCQIMTITSSHVDAVDCEVAQLIERLDGWDAALLLLSLPTQAVQKDTLYHPRYADADPAPAWG